jgi:CRP-like cAMP-binding protein
MSYLSAEARRHGESSFTIDFNRQQLADFLSVDRSAMSSELGRMKDEGLIDYHKQDFSLL